MGEVKQINIKNRTYYFYSDMINLKNWSNLLKIDRKSYKNIGIYNIWYITIKKIGGCENIYSVTLLFNQPSRYIEEKNENKYLIFNSTDENKELLKKYLDVWSGIKNKMETVSSGECGYEKGYIKVIWWWLTIKQDTKILHSDYNHQISIIHMDNLTRFNQTWLNTNPVD